MDEQEENQHNMISNLPLLFANGYPTSLEKITEKQLESFIPFMVQCSLGHINLQGKMDYSEPEWWPEDLPFIVPFAKPKKFTGDWLEKMKQIVVICYTFHKSIFLLRFCNDLASYEHASLRFINNYNSTTSLFDRRSSKLLVTFRNENMSYDQPQRNRKCLLQQKSKNDRQTTIHPQHIMVEPAPFDIYLCDNCDAELYSKEAVLEHEKTCLAVEDEEEDDDVILCDTPEPCEVSRNDSQNHSQNNELRKGFLLNFGLQSRESTIKNKDQIGANPLPNPIKEENFLVLDRNRRMPRRNRTVHTLSRCPTIPLSSPAGQLLLRTTKAIVPIDYLTERLERMERFCHTPLLARSSTNRPRYLDKKYMPTASTCTFKKPIDYSTHIYVFPRRQFSQKRRRDMLYLNSSLLKRCRPISVRLKKIKRDMPSCSSNSNSNSNSTKLNIKLTRDTSRTSNWKVSSCSTEVIVDTIDLCSSDDEEITNNVVSIEKSLNRTNTPTTSSSVRVSQQNKFSSTLPSSSSSSPSPSPSSSLRTIQKTRHSDVTVHSSRRSTATATADKSSPIVVNEVSANIKSTEAAAAYAIPTSSDGSLKPLRPSLYIFSNYTLVGNSNDVVSSVDSSSNSTVFRANNQENHQVQSSTARKRSTIATSTPASNWLPVTSNFVQNNNNNNNNTQSEGNNGIQGHLHEKDRASRSISLAQKFNSPSRIISIDLTS